MHACRTGLLTPDEAAELEVAALLHDIGKIGVPDAILLKPGPLTPEEWDIMRGHDQVGVDIAATAGMPSNVVCIIASHHAKFTDVVETGTTMSEGIRTAARLLSVADAYDAMTSDRPYRKHLSPEEAFVELRRCAGNQFDPAIVNHFIESLREEIGHGPKSKAPRQAA